MNWVKDLRMVEQLGAAAENVAGQTINFIPKVLVAIIVLLAGLVAVRITIRIVRRSLATGKVDPTSGGLIVSVARFGMWIVLIAGVLWILGLKTISAAVAGTAALVAMALAQGAQGVTADILAGIFLVGDPRFCVGRRVKAGGVEGTVKEINIRKTVILADDGTVRVLPNRSVDAAAYEIKSTSEEQAA
jgi:small conductance mechanosensitive channel